MNPDGFGCRVPASGIYGAAGNDFSRNDAPKGFDRDHGAGDGPGIPTVSYGNWDYGSENESGKTDDDHGIANGAAAGFESANENGGFLQGRRPVLPSHYAL